MNKFSSLINSSKKWFLAKPVWLKILLPISILGLGWLGIYQLQATQTKTTYQFANVKKTDLRQTVSETGEVTNTNKTEVLANMSGIVTEVYVVNGQKVKRGDKLFFVTATATEAERSKANSDYLSAKNTLAQAEAKIGGLDSAMWQAHETFRTQALDMSLAPEAATYIQTKGDWVTAEANYKNQTQAIAQAKAQVNSAWLAYQATQSGPVKATADGQVANIAIAAGQNVTAADAALTLKTSTDIWVKVAMSENNIVEILPDQSATVVIDALGATKEVAKVQRVDEFATLVSDVPIYYVYLSLNSTKAQIRPGMTAQVEIATQEKKAVLAIPAAAVKPYQGAKAVQILDPQTQTVIYQPITIGISDETMTEVISGLEENQQIILSIVSAGSATTTTKSTGTGGVLMRPPGG